MLCSFARSELSTGYTRAICRTFGVCLIFLTLLLLRYMVNKSLIIAKRSKNFACLNSIHDFYIQYITSKYWYSVIKEIIIFVIFSYFFSFWDMSCQKTLRTNFSRLGGVRFSSGPSIYICLCSLRPISQFYIYKYIFFLIYLSQIQSHNC